MDFFENLKLKAIRSGDIFSANKRNSPFFYFSYNYTLSEIAEKTLIQELI